MVIPPHRGLPATASCNHPAKGDETWFRRRAWPQARCALLIGSGFGVVSAAVFWLVAIRPGEAGVTSTQPPA